MTTPSSLSLRTVTFGSIDGGVWGAAWFTDHGTVVLASTSPGAGDAVLAAAPDTLAGSESAEAWRLAGDGIELSITGAAEAMHGRIDGGADGFDQLCRVHGTARVAGAEVEVDCLGRRAARSALDLSRYQSIRDVSAWFEPDEGLALTALRPRKAKDQAKDVILAAVLEAHDAKRVVDPRLSTTYDAQGSPSRVGLELWIEEENGGEYPWRAAGESLLRVDGDLLQATLMHFHGHGRDGLGVYLLASAAR